MSCVCANRGAPAGGIIRLWHPLAWPDMAGVLINAHGTTLPVDPLLTMDYATGRGLCEADYPLKLPPPIEAKDLPCLDAVLYTHADNDHFGRPTAQLAIERFSCRLANCI